VDDVRQSRALVALFFLSGATSLVYQTVWQRELHLLLGTSSTALATVLAAFMGGLGLGGLVGARWAPARPLAAYGRLEAAIGLYAVLFPVIVDLAEPLYLGIVRGPLAPWAGPLQALLAGVLLLPPTVASFGHERMSMRQPWSSARCRCSRLSLCIAMRSMKRFTSSTERK
jgi:hypothetical protein